MNQLRVAILAAVVLLLQGLVALPAAAQKAPDDQTATSAKALADGVYWGFLPEVDTKDSTVLFYPQCTGLFSADFDSVPRDEKSGYKLPIGSSTELWYLVVPEDQGAGAYYDKASDLATFSAIVGTKPDAPWSLSLRGGVVDWIQEDGFGRGTLACGSN